jgi:hypothetical protein
VPAPMAPRRVPSSQPPPVRRSQVATSSSEARRRSVSKVDTSRGTGRPPVDIKGVHPVVVPGSSFRSRKSMVPVLSPKNSTVSKW